MRTKIYEVSPDVDDTHHGAAYFANKRDAIALAKRMKREGKHCTEVTMHYVTDDLRRPQLYARLLNATMWSGYSQTLWTSDEGFIVHDGVNA